MVEINNTMIVVGVNFKKTPLEIRGRFSLNPDQIKKTYTAYKNNDIADFFILSTCNRTEIYSTAGDARALLNILVENTEATGTEVAQYSFVKWGDEAIKHLFYVAAGLDSQILGDHEIIAQLKSAFTLAKSYHKTSGLMEKLVNSAVQSSRQVKAKTALSNGTTSVSYAVIQLLKQNIGREENLRICLMGMGKIGTLTLKNLIHYLPQANITLINRDEVKAETAAHDFNVSYMPFSSKKDVIKNSGVLIVATACEHPLISKEDIATSNVQLIFDLSVPSNVSGQVRELEQVKFYNIDELSKMVNESMDVRKCEIPAAERIVQEHLGEFKQWEIRRSLYTVKQLPIISLPGPISKVA